MADEGQVVRENLPIGTTSVVFESMQFDLEPAIAHIESLYTNKEVTFHQLLKFVCRQLHDFDYKEMDLDGLVPLGTLQVNFANRVWQHVFGFNGPESPWKKICDGLSDGTLVGHNAEAVECKVLLEDALYGADNSGELIGTLAEGHRDTQDYRVFIHILSGSSIYGAAFAPTRELEKQLSAERASNRGLRAEAAMLRAKVSWMEAELAPLKAGFEASEAKLASWTGPVPKADQGTKKRKMAEMPSTEALFQ